MRYGEGVVSVLDILLPKFCVGCQTEGSWLCEACQGSVGCSIPISCPDCEEVTEEGRYCSAHRGGHLLEGMVWLDRMDNRVIREAIHTLKYGGVRELGNRLGRLLAIRLHNWPVVRETVIVPIPLHRSRQQERGFNQAELIAAELPGYKKERLLVRYRIRPPQAGLSRDERLLNAQAVYGVPMTVLPRLQGKTVLLVDDVSTTGATFEAAAAVLKRAGAAEIWGAVIAKG